MIFLLRHKLSYRLAKKRSKEIEILTVFTKEGDIVCSHEAPNASAEQPNNYFVSIYQRGSPVMSTHFRSPTPIHRTHLMANIPANLSLPQPNSAEGRYLRLALELGFKQEGCPFEFGNANWLSGTQEEVDDKLTLLGLPDGEVSKRHRGNNITLPPSQPPPQPPLNLRTRKQLEADARGPRDSSIPETDATSSTASCRPRADTSSRLCSGKGPQGRWSPSPCASCGSWPTSWRCTSSGPGRAASSRRSPRRSEMGPGCKGTRKALGDDCKGASPRELDELLYNALECSAA